MRRGTERARQSEQGESRGAEAGELGDEFRGGVVDGELPLLGEHHNRDGGYRLGHGVQAEDGVALQPPLSHTCRQFGGDFGRALSECGSCHADEEQYCERGATGTYNSYERGTRIPTYGGYSTNYVVAERFALKIPAGTPSGKTFRVRGKTIRNFKIEAVTVSGCGGMKDVVVVASLGWLINRIWRARKFKPELSVLALRAERMYPGLSGSLASGFDFSADLVHDAPPHDRTTGRPGCRSASP